MTPAIQTIGIFDSGIGGFSVLRPFVAAYPANYLYLGDNARAPYGDRPPEEIIAFVKEGAAFLLERGVDALLLACNTASVLAGDALRREYPNLPLFDTTAAVCALVAKHHPRHLGLLATAATVHSRCYEEKLLAQDPAMHMESIACPNWVPLVEQNQFGTAHALHTVENTVRPWMQNPPEAVLLGCTHFPFLRREIEQLLPGVPLLDPAEEILRAFLQTFVADAVMATMRTAWKIGGQNERLKKEGTEKNSVPSQPAPASPSVHICTTGNAAAVHAVATRIFPHLPFSMETVHLS